MPCNISNRFYWNLLWHVTWASNDRTPGTIVVLIMHRYWLDLFLLAYTITCVDVMITAHGIYTGIGLEGNPVVVAIVPSSEPILQILFMAATTVASFWFIFYSRHFVPNITRYTKMIAWGSVFACGTHMFGIVTWFM